MMETSTGHPEIDRQHHLLNQIIGGLAHVCQQESRGGSRCNRCVPSEFDNCANQLTSLISDLISFMFEHFAYEEKLMRLLPDSKACKLHIAGHQKAHADISERLAELSSKLGFEDPRQSSLRLSKIITAWMGGHNAKFDAYLASSLEGAYGSELTYDVELGKLLASGAQRPSPGTGKMLDQ
jgi:hemerythrin-like metal-binding protein